MMRHTIAWLVLLALVVSVLPWELDVALATEAPSGVVEAMASHAPVDSSQQNPTDPCSGDCLCFCCHGHTTSPPPFFALAIDLSNPAHERSRTWPQHDLHPADVMDRVLRPPRLG